MDQETFAAITRWAEEEEEEEEVGTFISEFIQNIILLSLPKEVLDLNNEKITE